MTTSAAVPRTITQFRGAWVFLSNFHQAPVAIAGITYPSGEHAFQAAKTDDPAEKKRIAAAYSSQLAKSMGRSVTLVNGWNEWRRYDAMERVIAAKFVYRSTLGERLLATNNAILVEDNTWHDNTWGVCHCGKCKGGHNLLGWMLMRRRAQWRDEEGR